jgi:hypothetical protein
MQIVLKRRVDAIEFVLVDWELRVTPWQHARENKLHNMADEHVAKVGLNVER